MPTKEDRLKKLKEKKNKIDAQIKEILARDKEAERKKETRKKILAGSMVLDLVENGKWPHKEPFEKLMDQWLTRDIDRKLFGLEQKKEAEKNPAEKSKPS